MLNSRLFANNPRLNAAANNAPEMRRDEADRDAVRLLQQALRDLQIASMRRSIGTDGMFDGDYGGETFRAVKKFQRENSLATADGIVGRNTLRVMDRLLVALRVAPQTAAVAAAAPPPVETPATLRQEGIPRLPSSARMYQEYLKFAADDGKPCRMTGRNQCAVRMSLALGRSGIGFHFNAPSNRRMYVHRPFLDQCGGNIEVPHDNSAGRLFQYLQVFWTFTAYELSSSLSGADVYSRIANTPAIIFFRTMGTSGGNHIDYFDGQRIMNDKLNYRADNEPRNRTVDSTFRATRRAIHVLPLT
jgi:hypothetical protein